LKQVLLNLYLNAIHAIDHDGVITVAASECGDGRVKVSVADSGKGMTAEQLQAIFTPYSPPEADGTGLGLAVVQNIIEQHGGMIHAESAPGKARYLLSFCRSTGNRRMNKDEWRAGRYSGGGR
jgi:two-component system sensor histidine kinase HydH